MSFTALLELLSPNRGCLELVLAGDFNCHVDDQNNQPGFKFSQILNSFDFTQHTNVATHKRDHTLDLIITRSENICTETMGAGSRDFAVNCKLLITKPSFPRKQSSFRKTS